MSDALDMLIDTFVSDAQLAGGYSLEWMQARGLVMRPVGREQKPIRCRFPRWQKEEEDFYLAHVGVMSYEQIAAALGRSAIGLHVHLTRSGLPMASKVDGYITTCQVARILGIDSHKPPVWVDEGIMPGERIPFERCTMRRISVMQFKLWLVRPTSWVYFDAKRMTDAHYQRLVMLAQERWGDEWWNTTQAAAYHGCNDTDIHRQIKLGKISGHYARMMGSRSKNPAWARWFVRKSDAVKLTIHKGKGSTTGLVWGERAEAFMLRMWKEGKTYEDIARMMKRSFYQVRHHLHDLNRRSQ